MLPSWVAEPVQARAVRRRRRLRFVERMLRDAARFLENTVFAERAARSASGGFLQRLDARVKLISTIALLAGAAFLHHIPSLWCLGGFALLAAAMSRVGVRVLFSRVWWFLPGFFVVAAAPAVLNVVTPGDSILTLFESERALRLGPIQLANEVAVTRQGLASAGLLVTRIFLGVLLAVSLTLTTRWQDLLRAAHTSVTAPFVLITGMTHRYTFVLLRAAENMHLAKRARTIVPGTAGAERRWTGDRIGALFSRSRHLAERIYWAMLARGYTGAAKALTQSRLGPREALWLAACTAVIALAAAADRTLLQDLPW